MSRRNTAASRPRYTWFVAAAAIVLTGAFSLPVVPVLAAAPGTSPAATSVAASPVSVTVNASAGLGAIPGNAIGLNTAVYDGHMNDAVMPDLIKAAGITALRYPGGSYSDIFNWKTNVAEGGYNAPNTSFADFMETAQAVGADPIITVNYGTGTPELAADWVRHANVTNDYGITYWEVGNETYGNGTYGANWEADNHCTTADGRPIPLSGGPSQTYNCGPSVYAAGVLKFTAAMKKVSPDIHVCTVLTTPGFWPDNVTKAETSPKPWNQTVLTALGAGTDCVIVHYYPAYGSSNIASMLAAPAAIPSIIATLQDQIRQYAGVDPATVPIVVTEANSSIATNTQPGALFTADMYQTWLENGVTNIDYWNQHNGPGIPSIVNGAQDYGDYGIFSNGTNGSGVDEPPVNTPFAPYYGLQILSRLGLAGDTVVNSTSADPLVRVHAVRPTAGGLNVLLINENPTTSYPVDLDLSDFTPSGTVTVHTFANNAKALTQTTQKSATSVTIAPYSLTVLQIPGSGTAVATVPGRPGQPTVSRAASTTAGRDTGTATLSWRAAEAGSYPVTRYQVLQVGEGGGTVVASQTGTTLDLDGLTIGASYRYQVVALDGQGNPSLPSAALAVTVPPPVDASCAVHYEVGSSWSGGLSASVTLTNRADAAVDDWTLTFTWPAAGEALQSGWSGTWSQTGQTVSVTGTGSNVTLSGNGGSTTLGFNATIADQGPAPAAFFLNGHACANV